MGRKEHCLIDESSDCLFKLTNMVLVVNIYPNGSVYHYPVYITDNDSKDTTILLVDY